MQSAGRAVTSPHPASLYTSSRHALSRPARHAGANDYTWSPSSPIVFAAASSPRDFTWRPASPIVFSHPEGQKRCASSKTPPPRSGPRNLVYKGRQVPSVKKGDVGSILRSSSYQPTYYGRSPSPPPSAADRLNPNDIGSLYSANSKRSGITVVPRRSPPPPEDLPGDGLPSTTSESSPSLGSRPEPSHAVPDEAPGTTTADIDDLSLQVDRLEDLLQEHVSGQPPHVSEEGASDLMAETSQQADSSSEAETLALEKQALIESEEALKQQRLGFESVEKSYTDLQKSFAKLQSSHAEDLSRIKTAHTQKLEAQAKRHRNSTRDMLKINAADRIKIKYLEEQLNPFFRQQQRRAAESDKDSRQRQLLDEARLRRGRIRKDYTTFRHFAQGIMAFTGSLWRKAELFPLRVRWSNREAAHCSSALRSFETFERSCKAQDEARFWLAGEQLQAQAEEQQDATLHQQVIDQLKTRLQHRDSIFSQVRSYIQESGEQSRRDHLAHAAELRRLETLFVGLKSRLHEHRRLIRATRFDMNTAKTTPEMLASDRASTVDISELEIPLKDLKNGLIARVDFWKGKRIESQEKDWGYNKELLDRFYKTQINISFAIINMINTIRRFTNFQLEATEAQWVLEQPLFQQLFWQDRQRVGRRHTQLLNNLQNEIKWLRSQGLQPDHKILSAERIFDLVPVIMIHMSATFAHAYLKDQRNLLTKDDELEVKHTLQSYMKANLQDSKSDLYAIEHALDDLLAMKASHVRTGKRSLEPSSARSRRRDSLRKAASAKAQQRARAELADENFLLDDDDFVDVEVNTKNRSTEKGPIMQRAVSKEAASSSPIDTMPTNVATDNITQAALGGDDIAQADTKADSTEQADMNADSTAQADLGTANDIGPVSDSIPLPDARATVYGPKFKPMGDNSNTSLRGAAKPTITGSRARGRLRFKPPKPVFKETGRRSQDLRSSPADFLEEENYGAIANPALQYHIPSQDLRDALLASKTSQAAFWKYSLYKSPTGQKPLNHYCTKFEQAEQVARLFLGEKVIGFDIEWEMNASITRGSIKENVSLIQIACDGRIALFQIALFAGNKIEDLMPPTLKQILESPDIIKAGVNIAGDFTRLRKCLGIEGQGIFELSHLYKLVKYSEKEPSKVNKSSLKLADQVQDVLFLPMGKGTVRTSAWSRRLSMEQVDYAATDAYAGFRLFQELEWARKAMNPMPPRPALWELGQPIILGNGEPAGKKSKAAAAAAGSESKESDSLILTPEEQQAIDDEEDEAQSDAEVDCIEDADTEDAENHELESSATLGYGAAEDWLEQWESNLPSDRKGKSVPTSIRAYALWHTQGLGLEQVAEAMRDPPLALTTVASYVLDVVKTEKLPYEPKRAQEAVEVIPAVARGRYRSLLRRIETNEVEKTM